jgi:hypothetical protein
MFKLPRRRIDEKGVDKDYPVRLMLPSASQKQRNWEADG